MGWLIGWAEGLGQGRRQRNTSMLPTRLCTCFVRHSARTNGGHAHCLQAATLPDMHAGRNAKGAAHFRPLVCHCLSAADNVGDNVGDIAGMGADLFGSFAESTCAALVVAGVSELGANHNWPAMMFPLMVSATGIIVCMLTTLIATDLKPARHISEIEHTLKMQLIISTVLMTPVSHSLGWGVAVGDESF